MLNILGKTVKARKKNGPSEQEEHETNRNYLADPFNDLCIVRK